jgi:hypothetical protein
MMEGWSRIRTCDLRIRMQIREAQKRYKKSLFFVVLTVIDPDQDPHWFSCPGSGSGSVVFMLIRIWIQEWPKLTKKQVFLPFRKAFVVFGPIAQTTDIFQEKINFLGL